MALFLSVRSHDVGGPVVDPMVLQGDVGAPGKKLVDWPAVEAMVAGKNVLFGVHGFNVSREHGMRSLGQLESYLSLTASDLFFGVLWPGDFWLPVVNYPFEGADAIDSGRRIAAACRRSFAKAQSLSFVSHSLGARVVLEAVTHLDRPARVVCLTAAAINRDCLANEYANAAANAHAIAILASRKDLVLKLAFPVGDPIADVLHEDHALFEPALGREGPPPPAPPPVVPPWQIPDSEGFDHGDYLPPSDHVQDPATASRQRWWRAAGFMGRAFHAQPQTWP